MTSARLTEARSATRAAAATGRWEVVLVDDEMAFASLAVTWNAAAGAALSSNVFLRHEWARAAWSWRRLDSSLALLVARDSGTSIAVLPLVRPHAARRSLELLTVPDTQFADLVVSADHAAPAAAAFAEALAQRKDWDVLRLDYLQPCGAIALHLVPALAAHGVKVDVVARGVNAFIALDRRWNDYLQSRSRRLKKALNLASNRLRKAGTVRIERIDSTASDDACERALRVAIDISGRSWKSRTGNSLDQPGPQAFVRALSSAARAEGWLSIWLLHLDERPLAMEYQLISDECVHALRSDFVAECDDLSPGSHLFRHLLEASFDTGLERYYLGPGDNPYKTRWSEDGEPMIRAQGYQRTLRGRLAWLVEYRVKPPLRRLRDGWLRPGEVPKAARRDDDASDSA